MMPEVKFLYTEEGNEWESQREKDLQEWKERIRVGHEVSRQVSRPPIQRVTRYMSGREEFRNFYLPNLISVGPIHFDKRYVKQGEEYKHMWTAMYLRDTNQNHLELLIRLYDHIDEIISLFSPGCWGGRLFISDNDKTFLEGRRLSRMFLVDGCAVLHLLDKSDHSDPEQVLQVSIDELVRAHQDMFLLENQIPYLVLKLLCNDEARLNKCMHNFLKIHGIVMASRTGKLDPGREKQNANAGGELPKEHKVIVEAQDQDQDQYQGQDQDEPIHLLDYLRRALLMSDQVQIHREIKINRKSLHLRKYRIGTIRELKAAGIRAKKKPNNTSFLPSFVDGKLQLPELTVDVSTAHIFLNLIAYEMCPDFRNNFEISSYIVFLSSLIDQSEDVKELRFAGILRNELASDKEVADLFNRMDTVLVPETARFAHIRDQIEAHFESKRGKIKILGWMGEAYNTYFRSPWTVIALLAAAFGLVLTFIQTWFAIHPKGS